MRLVLLSVLPHLCERLRVLLALIVSIGDMVSEAS